MLLTLRGRIDKCRAARRTRSAAASVAGS